MKHTTQDYIDHLDWQQRPVDGGQIVDVTYATDEDGLWRRRHDQSDRSVTFEFARYDGRASEDRLAFEPWNDRLPAHGCWQSVVVN